MADDEVVSTEVARIFLMSEAEKIVVSDLDGTITRSDIGGLVLPAMGLSAWAHNGVVRLYQAVAARGYRLLYLSARPFTLYPSTASYIRSLRGLPAGPLLLDPHFSLQETCLRKLQRSWSPDEQKINKLTEIGNLFPAAGGGPFFAGYGNTETDKRAYERVGIDEGRIFRVDKKSRIRVGAGAGAGHNFTEHIENVPLTYPLYR